jgi:hypothetical protein
MKYIIYFSIILFPLSLIGQTGNWSVKNISTKAFIKNKGQFNKQRTYVEKEILYAVDHGGTQVYFTKNGVIYRFYDWERNPARKKGDPSQPKYLLKQEFVEFEWEGSKQDVTLIAGAPVEATYTYAMRSDDRKNVYDISSIKGYEKLMYKNLYPGIDVEFEFHPETGIKYSVILHPGADASQYKMKYINGSPETDSEGNIIINTTNGPISEKAPFTFYEEGKQLIPSWFVVNNNVVSISLTPYNTTRTVIIDPWIVLPTLPNSNCVWECETDSLGNVYITGGEYPMKLLKYNAAGALQWTYTTPWDTATVWLGTLATLPNGDCFITSGTAPEMERINTSNGTMLWHTTGGSFTSGDDEFWTIAFNCDYSKMIVGGTKLFGMTMISHAALFDVNMTNGNIDTVVSVHTINFGVIGVTPVEVRSIASTKTGKYVGLTHKKVGIINQTPGQIPAFVPTISANNVCELNYKSENFMPATQNGAPLNAIAANGNYFFTHNGDKISKWSVVNAALLDSANVPGGVCQTFQGKVILNNAGVAVDDCGYVYAGSKDRVVKYDSNLNLLDSVMLPFTVYDVALAPNGNIVVCGAINNNSSATRTGYVQQIAFSACGPDQSPCCNANFSRLDSICTGDNPFQFTAYTPGGTWSGNGIDINGLFDPAAAGVGFHAITYTLGCGSETIVVKVKDCPPIEVCFINDSLFSSGGYCSPLMWQEYNQGSSFPITNSVECLACGGTWTPFVNICMVGGIQTTTCNFPAGWVTFHAGSSIPVPTQFPIRITDGCGFEHLINTQQEMDSLPECFVGNLALHKEKFSALLIPNPSDGNQRLVIHSENNSPVKISLTDITGRQIAYYETTLSKGRNEIFVNDFFAQNRNGYYYLTVENGSVRKTIALMQ